MPSIHRAAGALCLAGMLGACGGLAPPPSASAATPSQTAQSVTLAGTTWQVLAYDNGRQAVVKVQSGTSLSMSFGVDGQLAGSAGCNRYGGRYAQTGDQLTLGPLVSTRKGCALPEGLMMQESAFLRALETVATARRDGTRLELRSADGALLVDLAAAP